MLGMIMMMFKLMWCNWR